MTGTSLDGLDAALVEVRGRGLAITARCHAMVSRPLGDLTDVLRGLASGHAASPLAYLRAARRLGQLHAAAVAQLLKKHGRGVALDCVVAHGQTIWHAPAEHLSWQLFDPWPIRRRLGLPVLYDLRQADLIAGGQGAPITPMSDWVLFRHPRRHRLIVNLGGIINVTWLPAGGTPQNVRGGDIGPCNLLLDGLVRELFPAKTFDRDGRIARRGQPAPWFQQMIQKHPYYQSRRSSSTGREDFTAAWVRQLGRTARRRLTAADILATAGDFVAQQIAQKLRLSMPDHDSTQVVLAGGGSHNRTLVERIRWHCAGRAQVLRSDDLGIPAAAREAVGFAVLGALSQDGVPITLPAVTGAKAPGVAGVGNCGFYESPALNPGD